MTIALTLWIVAGLSFLAGLLTAGLCRAAARGDEPDAPIPYLLADEEDR